MKRRARSRRWAIRLGVAGALALLGVLAVTAALDLRSVRRHLLTARAQLERIRDPAAVQSAERRIELTGSLETALAEIEQARDKARGSAGLTVAQFVPVVRSQRQGLVRLIDDSRDGARTARRMFDQVQGLADRLRLQDGLVPFDSLEALRVESAAAGDTLGRLVRRPSGLWGELGKARRRFDDLASSSAQRLQGGSELLGAARGFLGGEGDRRYLVALQNNAEMRDQGMMLSYAVARFVGGRLAFEESGAVHELRLDRPAPTPVPDGTRQVFGSINPTELWQSVNATADFAWSGQAMRDMYAQATGQTIDGVIAIDVPGIAALLGVVGPVEVAGVPAPLTSGNVTQFLMHDQYLGLAPGSDQAPRRERHAELTRVVIDRLSGGAVDLIGLTRVLADSATAGHFRLWSTRPAEEAAFEHNGIGGGPALQEPDRTFHLAVQNRTATKLDYYVQPSVRQEVRLTPAGDAIVRTFVVLDNRAPVGAPPSYQLGPDEFTRTPGQYLGWVLLWGPAGSVQADAVAESGLLLSPVVVDIGPGEVGETSFETVVPDAVRDGRLSLRLVPQSRYKPVDLDVRLVDADGWEVVGPTSWQGPWDRVRTISWRVRR